MKANILIVDDEESIRFSFGKFLVADGHNVVTAEGYYQSLEKMEAMRFDLILADIVLEDGWGIEILREVMNKGIKTKVIIMTAYPTKDTVDASFRMQAADYLIKPIRQDHLLRSVGKALENAESGVDSEWYH